MKIYDCEQHSPEWYAVRLGMVTASNFHKAVSSGRGSAPSKTRKDYMKELVYERIHGIPFPQKFKGNSAMDHGTETEDEARCYFASLMGEDIKQVGFIEYNDDIGFSPDGLIGDDTTVEIKCPELLTYMDYIEADRIDFGSLSKAYRDQVQGGLFVTGRKYCYFVLYDSRYPSRPCIHARFDRDEEYIKQLHINLVMFIEEMKAMLEKLTPSPF
ncbi:hypothetical protein LCGC14_2235710 [marine sediment metagenome]|uniref:YqaJ viral recombinase domain-containing protein n=1 Tax=marine sediment metagenome TaxID=412755 RepID=A0A0F9D6P3_9ZZZZ